MYGCKVYLTVGCGKELMVKRGSMEKVANCLTCYPKIPVQLTKLPYDYEESIQRENVSGKFLTLPYLRISG